MIYGMYLSTMGALVQAAKHGTTANNLANANTTGFKPNFTVFREVKPESELQPSRGEVNTLLEKTGGGVWLDQTPTDFTPGPITITNNPLDMALSNPPDKDGKSGTLFFSLRRAGANPTQVSYSRDGHFLLNATGQLVTASGAFVLNASGETIRIPPDARPIMKNDGSGKILDENSGDELGQVGVFMLRENNYDKIKKTGENLYDLEPNAEPGMMTNMQVGVNGGALEGSATQAIQEMVNMIEGQRAYEANMTFLRMQDTTLGQVVSRLGRVQ